jgi:hypothetical protein
MTQLESPPTHPTPDSPLIPSHIREAVEAVLDHFYPHEALDYEADSSKNPNHIFHSLHILRVWIEAS